MSDEMIDFLIGFMDFLILILNNLFYFVVC